MIQNKLMNELSILRYFPVFFYSIPKTKAIREFFLHIFFSILSNVFSDCRTETEEKFLERI